MYTHNSNTDKINMMNAKELIITTIIYHNVNYAIYYEQMKGKSIEELTEFLIKLLKVKYLDAEI